MLNQFSPRGYTCNPVAWHIMVWVPYHGIPSALGSNTETWPNVAKCRWVQIKTLMPSAILHQWKISSKILTVFNSHEVQSVSNRFNSKPYGNGGKWSGTHYMECNKPTTWSGAGYDGNSCLHPSQQERGGKEIDELGRLQETSLGYCPCVGRRYVSSLSLKNQIQWYSKLLKCAMDKHNIINKLHKSVRWDWEPMHFYASIESHGISY